MRPFAWALAVTMMVAACRTSTTASPPAVSPSRVDPQQDSAMEPYPPPWSLVVGDGSGNVYACEHAEGGRAHCEYRPVTPAQSSTGRYSGGDPWDVPLAPAQVDALWREVDVAQRDTAGHHESRDKTTVAVEATGVTTGSFILHADAGAALVQVLTGLRPASAAGPSMQ